MKKGVKKKRRKKPDTKDSIYAVLLAGVLITAAIIISLVAINQGADITEEITIVETPAQPSEVSPPPAPPLTQPPLEHLPPAEHQPPVIAILPPVLATPPPVRLPEQPPVHRGTLVFVIDDAGNNLNDLDPFLRLDIPLTIAVLPGLPHSAEAARRIRAAGKEVFLHQPMEAIGGQDPGPGAIMTGMSRDEIRTIVLGNLEEIGPVTGMNNHAGSRVTMDEEAMETILNLCREKGILFLDSRTTAESAAPRAARRLGMNIGERDIFLDNIPDRESILRFIGLGLETAEQKGTVIMLGHVQSAALAPLLSELIPDLKRRGFSFSPASDAISGTGI